MTLPRPFDGSPQHFLYDEVDIVLYEVTRYEDQFRSTFVDELFCKRGHFNILTKIDPLFIFVPLLMKLTQKQYRTLHDICLTVSSENSSDISKIDYALSPDINWQNVCETKEIDGELFVKFDYDKTLKWLMKKHRNTYNVLEKELDGKASKATLISHATELISRYLPRTMIERFKSSVDIMKYNLGDSSTKDVKTTVAPQPSSSTKRVAEHKQEAKRLSISDRPKITTQPEKIPKESIMNYMKRIN